jgi:hypothetical protein
MAPKPPETLRVFIAGVSGSGKSTAAWHLYLAKYPRRLLLDQTGEWAERADAVVETVPQLSWALKRMARTGRWTVAISADLDVLPELVDYLIPVPDIARSPVLLSHGAVLLMDEVDLVAPPATARQEVRTLFRRSRHAGLSVVATTQRPENVSREVSAQAQHVLCLQLAEPRAYDYMSRLMQTELAGLPTWVTTHRHGGLWFDTRTRRRLWMTDAYRFTRPALEPAAAPVRPASAAPAGQRPAGEPEQEEQEPVEPEASESA